MASTFGTVDPSAIMVRATGGRQMRPKCKWAEATVRPPEPECLGEWSLTLHGVSKRQMDIFCKHHDKRLMVAFLVLGDSGVGRVTGTMLLRVALRGVVELEGGSVPLLNGKPLDKANQ